VAVDDTRFEFGANWRHFLETVDARRVEAAMHSLDEMVGAERLVGASFLDAGCGSGLFSLAARRLGARVHSFDYDPQSVACTTELKRRLARDDDRWTIEPGSVLDRAYLERGGGFEVVYSGGGPHHPGGWWEALYTVGAMRSHGGVLFISIYNDQGPRSRTWTRIKRTYCKSPPIVQRGLVLAVGAAIYGRSLARHLLRGRSLNEYREQLADQPRGMSSWYDLVDWVGGYPFEVAKPEDVVAFLRKRGYSTLRTTSAGGSLSCNEFVMVRDQPDQPVAEAMRSYSDAASSTNRDALNSR
jgi:2-polyprenyl-6-hydroxyphenyl methylase/3-demethylubiquinone-9 3-methyltransferase